jgi:hypothetical protein
VSLPELDRRAGFGAVAGAAPDHGCEDCSCQKDEDSALAHSPDMGFFFLVICVLRGEMLRSSFCPVCLE